MKAAGVKQVKLSDVWRGGQGSADVLATFIEVAEVDMQDEMHHWLKYVSDPGNGKKAATQYQSVNHKAKEKAKEETMARIFMVDAKNHKGDSSLLGTGRRVRVVSNPGTILTCKGMFHSNLKKNR